MRRRRFLSSLAAAAPATLLGCRSRASDPPPALWTPQPRPLATGFHRGMNFAHLHRRGYGYGSDRAYAQLRHLASIGVTDIALNPFAYTRSLSSPEIQWGGDDSMTDDDIRTQCRQAASLGIRVMMKPHLWSWAWVAGEGNTNIDLDAADWPRWFETYTAYAVHFASLAAESGCHSLCVGLEYTVASRENPGAWAKVADACRAVFAGQVLYAANWYQEWEQFTDWAAFDAVGVDAYFPLTGTTVEELSASWKEPLDRLEALGRPVIFTEAGFQAIAGAATHPWESHDDGTPDPEGQARAYESLMRACTARPWFHGVYWWKWFTDLPGERDPFVPAGKPAEDVLHAWFRGQS